MKTKLTNPPPQTLPINLLKKEKKGRGGLHPGPGVPPLPQRHTNKHQFKKNTPQGHTINQFIDPRGNNNPTLP